MDKRDKVHDRFRAALKRSAAKLGVSMGDMDRMTAAVPKKAVDALHKAFEDGQAHGRQVFGTASINGGDGDEPRDVLGFRAGLKRPLAAPRMKPWIRATINGLMLTAASVITADTVGTVEGVKRRGDGLEVTAPVLKNGIYASAILLWGPIFDLTVGWHRLLAEPKLLVGFLIPMIINGIDMSYALHMPPDTVAELKAVDKDLTSDAASVISAAFAMGTLLSGMKTQTGTRLIMYALVLSLALVIPSARIPSDTLARTAVQTIQKAALSYAIGFIVIGISMDLVADPLTMDESLPGGADTDYPGWLRRLRGPKSPPSE